MQVLVMPAMTSQFLQVPKVLPHRKSRSRSRSRTRETTSGSTSTTSDFVLSTARLRRPQTPPIPSPDIVLRPTLESFSTTSTTMYDHFESQPRTTPPYSPNLTHSISATSKPVPAFPATSQREAALSPPEDTTGTNYDDLSEDVYTLEQCRTPPPAIPLRQKLIGAWKLESYIAYPTPGSPIQRPTYPMTKNVTGFIMYTPDGYMSAQMLIPGQQSFKRGEGEEPQWAEAGKRFFAYCGPYYISNEGLGREETLRHTFQVCNLPGWIGDIQIRTHHFEEDGQVLVLGSEEPAEIKGDKRIPVLKWRRARDNADGDPPPPTPQIKISGPGEL